MTETLVENILIYVDRYYKLNTFHNELMDTKRGDNEVYELDNIRRLPEGSQELLDDWDEYACGALGYNDTSPSNRLNSFRDFLRNGCVPPDAVIRHLFDRNDDDIGTFLDYLKNPGHDLNVPGISRVEDSSTISYQGITSIVDTFTHDDSRAQLKVVRINDISEWQDEMLLTFAHAQNQRWQSSFVRFFADTTEFNEPLENNIANFIDELMYGSTKIELANHTLFLDGESLKSVLVELYRKIDDMLTSRAGMTLSDFHDDADYVNKETMNGAFKAYNDAKNSQFNDIVEDFINNDTIVIRENLEKSIDNVIQQLIKESIGGFQTSGDITQSSVAIEPSAQTGADSSSNSVINLNSSGDEDNSSSNRSGGSAGDTGDMNSWASSKDGLDVSEEFVDPDSSLYKYVAYYKNDSREVDHFLVTYDQNVDQHYSTNKTLRWDDTRQTRRQAYNILICSDKISREFSLLPWPGSDAECAINRDVAGPVDDVPEQVEVTTMCTVDSEVNGDKITLDFSECPINADTITGDNRIDFGRRGVENIVIKLENSGDPSPYLRNEISFIKFGASRFMRAHEPNFESYFIYLQRLMRYSADNYSITGDLSSFPRFSSGAEANLEEQIDKIINDIISEEVGRKHVWTSSLGRGRGRRRSPLNLRRSRRQRNANSANIPHSSVSLDDLSTAAKAAFVSFFAAIEDHENYRGVNITSGHRMPSKQQDLITNDIGITPDAPCESDHQYGNAVDINVVKQDGTLLTSRGGDDEWQAVADIAGGHDINWQGSSDKVHFYFGSRPTNATKRNCRNFYGNTMGKAGEMADLERQKEDEINRILDIV